MLLSFSLSLWNKNKFSKFKLKRLLSGCSRKIKRIIIKLLFIYFFNFFFYFCRQNSWCFRALPGVFVPVGVCKDQLLQDTGLDSSQNPTWATLGENGTLHEQKYCWMLGKTPGSTHPAQSHPLIPLSCSQDFTVLSVALGFCASQGQSGVLSVFVVPAYFSWKDQDIYNVKRNVGFYQNLGYMN